MPISLVLADDHPIILDGLEMLFRAEQDFQVLARCVNGEETIQAVRQHRPDVLILDIRNIIIQRNGIAGTVLIQDLIRNRAYNGGCIVIIYNG